MSSAPTCQFSPTSHHLIGECLDVAATHRDAQVAVAGFAGSPTPGCVAISDVAWTGTAEKGKGHYYRISAPTFLVEYDNTQNDGNHVHSVWRDFERDFGRDLLRDHLKSGH